MKIIMLGAPGAGKGTQAKKIADKICGLRVFEDENGKMNFYTLWDTGMLFWIESNESGWTTDAFLETFDARARMELQGNVIIACGEGTDAYGNVVPMAWYCVVDPGFIANVEVHCTDSDEADYWYEEFQNDAFWIENARGIYGEG